MHSLEKGRGQNSSHQRMVPQVRVKALNPTVESRLAHHPKAAVALQAPPGLGVLLRLAHETATSFFPKNGSLSFVDLVVNLLSRCIDALGLRSVRSRFYSDYL